MTDNKKFDTDPVDVGVAQQSVLEQILDKADVSDAVEDGDDDSDEDIED